jgi:hypothetical protein
MNMTRVHFRLFCFLRRAHAAGVREPCSPRKAVSSTAHGLSLTQICLQSRWRGARALYNHYWDKMKRAALLALAASLATATHPRVGREGCAWLVWAECGEAAAGAQGRVSLPTLLHRPAQPPLQPAFAPQRRMPHPPAALVRKMAAAAESVICDLRTPPHTTHTSHHPTTAPHTPLQRPPCPSCPRPTLPKPT